MDLPGRDRLDPRRGGPAVTVTWCRSCGTDACGPGPACGVCGVPLVAPDPGPARVGRQVAVRVNLRNRIGIVVDERAGEVDVLVRGCETRAIPLADADARAQPVTEPAVTGAAGRLWAALRARPDQSGWDAEAIADAATRHATASLATRRAAAIDLATLGDPGPEVNLTDSEVAWYRARAAGDAATLVALLERLPATGYVGRVALLLRVFNDLDRDAGLARRARNLLAGFDSLEARALAAALDIWSPASEMLRPVAAVVAGAGGPRILAAAAAAFGSAAFGSAAAPDNPALRAFLASPASARWPATTTSVLRCRLSPGEVTADDLHAAGFVAELARRHYVAGDDAALAALPDDDADVRHYRALRAWADRRPGADLAALRPSARAVVDALSFTEDQVPAVLAGDRSAWPRLAETVFRRTLTLDDAVRTGYPGFGDWFDVCGLLRLLSEGRWDLVRTEGRRVAARTTTNRVADEAMNMVAYAEWCLGHRDAALEALAAVRSSRPTVRRSVNAALVASGKGCAPALPHLADVMRRSRDADLRRATLRRALSLWQTDGGGFPATLAGMVRGELTTPTDDDGYQHELLVLSLRWDAEWLGGARIPCAGTAQAHAARFYRARAALPTEWHRDAWKEIAAALVAASRLRPRPDWVDAQRDWIDQRLSNRLGMDADGEATSVIPAVEILLDGEVLTPASQLRMSLLAGVVWARRCESRNVDLPATTERQLVIDPARAFLLGSVTLTADETRELQALIGPALTVAASVTLTAIHRHMQGLPRLVDFDNAPRVTRALAGIDDYLNRLRSYIQLMNRLPRKGEIAELHDAAVTVANQLSGWLRRSRAVVRRVR